MKWKLGFEFEIQSPFSHASMRGKLGKITRGLKVVNDCSIKRSPGYYATEIITPPLVESQAKRLMLKLNSFLKSEGCITDKSCGFHINLSFNNACRKFNPSMLIATTDDFHIAQQFNRHTNVYCTPWKTYVKKLDTQVKRFNKRIARKGLYSPYTLRGEFDRMAQTLYYQTIDPDSDTPADEVMDSVDFHSKYLSVNLNNIKDYGYVEYRMIGGSSYLDETDTALEAIEHFKLSQTLAHEDNQPEKIDQYLEWAKTK